jgi:hypothetical protein
VKRGNCEDSDGSDNIDIPLSEDELQKPGSDQNLEDKVQLLLSKPLRGLNRRN